MPTSQPESLTTVHQMVQRLQPRSIIDVGIGHGKFGVLTREFLDMWALHYKPREWTTKIYGIEAFADYHNPLWDYAYDSVVVGDALEQIGALPDVDLIVALDVWEHFEPAYAQALLTICLQKSRFVLICTPMQPAEQGDVFGNDYERHVSVWTPKDFDAVPHRLITCAPGAWVLLLSTHHRVPRQVRALGDPRYHIREGVTMVRALCGPMVMSTNWSLRTREAVNLRLKRLGRNLRKQVERSLGP